MFLYILLIIIAIGVLLISDTGRQILAILFGLAILGGVLYLGFWGVVIVWGLLSDADVRAKITDVLGYVVLICIAFWAFIASIFLLIEKYREGKLNWVSFKKAIKESYKKSKMPYITAIIFVSAMLFIALLGALSSWKI